MDLGHLIMKNESSSGCDDPSDIDPSDDAVTDLHRSAGQTLGQVRSWTSVSISGSQIPK
jgi:hypothetical protein